MMARSKGVRKAAPRKSASALTQGRPAEPALDNTQPDQAPASAEEGRAEATAASLPPQQETAEACITPLQYMLRVMRDRTAEPARRDEMAKLALPYLHAKPPALEHGGRTGGPVEIAGLSEADIARRIAFITRWGQLLGDSSER